MSTVKSKVRRRLVGIWTRLPESLKEVVKRTDLFRFAVRRLWPQGLGVVHFGTATIAPDRGRPRILILDWDLPQPTRSGGHGRLLEIAETLVEMGVSVTIGATNDLERTAGAWGVSFESLLTEAAALGSRFHLITGSKAIGAYLNEQGHRLSAVWFSRTYPALACLPHVLAAAPQARIAFDSMDAEYIRLARRAELNGLAESSGRVLNAIRREKLMVRVADSVIAVSNSDASALANLSKNSNRKITVIPNLYDLTRKVDHGNREAASWDLLFVGGFLHDPNVDAIRWFFDGVMPEMGSKRPRVAIVGHGLPRDLQVTAKRLGISYLGEVGSLEQVYSQSKVSIAPLRFGSGVKGKVIEAALHGLPVVGTAVAWEGIDVVTEISGLVADAEKAFAEAIVSLLEDNERRAALTFESGNWLAAFERRAYRGALHQILGVPSEVEHRQSVDDPFEREL